MTVLVFLCSVRTFRLDNKDAQLQSQYDELLSRVSRVLPGGAYIEEPKPFDKKDFGKDVSDAIDAKE